MKKDYFKIMKEKYGFLTQKKGKIDEYRAKFSTFSTGRVWKTQKGKRSRGLKKCRKRDVILYAKCGK